MKYLLYIVIFLTLSQAGKAQVVGEVPLQYERRETTKSHANARLAASTDTIRLQLPFFEDFSSIQVPVDSIKNSGGDTVEIFSKALHGLQTGDKLIYSLSVPKDTTHKGINGSYMAIVTSPFSFKLFFNSTTPLMGSGDQFIGSGKGHWLKPGSRMGHEPDTLKWLHAQGAYINNRFSNSPPSIGVATFDGLRSDGTPYNKISGTKIASCDTLTSRIIDLSKYTVADSLILSFYWQGKGNGEAPSNISGDADSLWLEFKNKAGVWAWVWGQPGLSSPFTYQAIPFKSHDSIVFHKNFQFRFRSLGNTGGMYDVWNLDYVYLNKSRHAGDSLLGDLAITKPLTSILAKYSAMPFKQFVNDRSSKVRSIFTTTVKNNNSDVAQSQRDFKAYDPINNQTLIDVLIKNSPVVLKDSIKIFNDVFSVNNLDNINLPTTITSKIFIPISDNIIPGLDLGVNNFDSTTTDIKDYFAYDDGSAEVGFRISGLGSRYTKMASKFTLAQADTLQYVQIYFPQKSPSESAQAIYLVVIKNRWDGQQPDDFYYNQSTKVKYVSGKDNFSTYQIVPPVKIEKGDFYVGIQKLTDVESDLTIGFDKNTGTIKDSTYDHIYNQAFYLKLNKTWSTVTSEGSFMIRPLFGSSSVTAIEEAQTENELSCTLFPNPSTGLINIKGSVRNVKVFDLAGRLMAEENYNLEKESNEMNLQELPGGFYIVHLSNDHLSAIKKLIISK